MADDMKLQRSLQGSIVLDIPKTEIEGSSVLDIPKAGTEGSSVLDIPKTEIEGSSVLDIPKTEIEGSSVSDIPKTETEDYFPTPPESPEHPDLWREQRWKDILSKEERTQQCTRCNEIGHGRHHCPYPVVCVLYTVDGEPRPMVCKPPEGKYRCSRCGRRGHNRRTCHGPVFY